MTDRSRDKLAIDGRQVSIPARQSRSVATGGPNEAFVDAAASGVVEWLQRAAEFNVVEASIADMQRAMQNGSVTSRELVRQYLTRIALYEEKLNAVITVNPNALRKPRRAIASVRRAECAGRCTAFRSRSRTTSTRRTCRRPAARSRSRASCRPTRRHSRGTCARPAPSSSPRPA